MHRLAAVKQSSLSLSPLLLCSVPLAADEADHVGSTPLCTPGGGSDAPIPAIKPSSLPRTHSARASVSQPSTSTHPQLTTTMYHSSSYPHHNSSPPHPPLHINHNHLLQSHDMAFCGSGEFYTQTPQPSYSSSSSLLLQRSSSSISFHHSPTSTGDNFHHQPIFDNHPELLDSQPAAMRRVFSTGDIDPFGGDGGSNSDASGAAASSVAAAIGGRVGRYNAEERRERIERYRNKRNQRNFQKKITYACRKTLADSRPRVRGRFARNGEPEPEMEAEEAAMMAYYGNGGGEVGGGGCYDWREVGAAGMSTAAVETTPAGGGEDKGYCLDDSELWTNFLDVFSSL